LVADGNVVLEKSFAFAVRMVKLAQFMQKERGESVLSRQVLRSGTSIGANVEEAQAAQSRKDFISKMAIASKESHETRYWLRLFKETNQLDVKHVDSLLDDCEELIRLLTAIVKTSQEQ
jgi:four helix bundle protein